MTKLTPEQLDELARAVPELAPQLAAMKADLQKPGLFKRVKHTASKIAAAILAAFTSPTAVKAEKSLAALVITRALITAGASVGTVGLVKLALKALGI